MPIIVALMLLWVGTLLDMASTYLLVVPSDKLREVNQNFVDTNGEFLFTNFFVINGVFLLVLSLATMFALRNRNRVKKYLRETGYGAHTKAEWGSMKHLGKEDRRVVLSVSALAFVGSAGGARFLFSINNLTEYYGSAGFMSLFLWAFPTVHDQIALIIVFCIAATAFSPITYLLLRPKAR